MASKASSSERKTGDDERGTRCFNRWPYRYFGEHTWAHDVIDPHDSIYPRATPRLGIKFQTTLITWEEQMEIGLGVSAKRSEVLEIPIMQEEPVKVKRPPGRPPKHKKILDSATSTPTLAIQPLPGSDAPQGSGNNSLAASTTPEATQVVGGNSTGAVTPEQEVERGTDDTVEAVWISNFVPDRVSDAYMRLARSQFKEHQHDVGMYNRALRLLNVYKGDAVQALAKLTNCTDEDLEIIHWSAKENKQFDHEMAEHGAELRSLKRAFPQRTPAHLVRKIYSWKGIKLGEQWSEERRLKRENGTVESDTEQVAKTDISTRALSPSLSVWGDEELASAQQKQSLSKENGMTASNTTATATNASKVCKMCATTHSPTWYKGPYSWHNRKLCVSCGVYWRKYASETSSEIMTRKREAQEDATSGVTTPVTKIAKLSRSDSIKASNTPSPAVAAKFEPSKCVMCKKMEPRRKLIQCRQCSLSVHQGCFGLSNEELEADVWFCDACDNERTLDAALIPICTLCPRPPLPPEPVAIPVAPVSAGPRPVGRPRKYPLPPPAPVVPVVPLDALDAFKPTECNNWTHLLCALFIIEIVFTEPELMKIVEGAGNLPAWRYEATCDLCEKRQGACVACAESTCKRTFHVSCASRQNGFTLGLDLTPVKSTRRDTVTTATFDGETGHMTAVVFCDAHKDVAKSRKLIDLSETDATQTATFAALTSSSKDGSSGSNGVTTSGGSSKDNAPTAAQIFALTHKSVRNGAGAGGVSTTGSTASSTSASDPTLYPLLRRAKRIDSVLGGTPIMQGMQAGSALSASARRSQPVNGLRSSSVRGPTPSQSTSARPGVTSNKENLVTDGLIDLGSSVEIITISSDTPVSTSDSDLRRNGTLREVGQMYANGSSTDQRAHGESDKAVERKECARCHTHFSPFWWDLPADVQESSKQPGAEVWLDVIRKAHSTLEGHTVDQMHKHRLCVRCRHFVLPALDAAH
jgi:hypothetical protein